MARILLIDDEESLRRSLKRMLGRAGHEVTPAQSVPEALRLWRRAGADLIITDIHMPERSGIELIVELRAGSPNLPIIAMSGGDRNPRLDVLGDAAMLGAVRTIVKPFTIAELDQAVGDALGRLAG